MAHAFNPAVSSTLFKPEFLEAVDFETFCFVHGTYYAAAAMTMPTRNPETIGMEVAGVGLALKDIPMNRGALAAVRQLRELKVENVYAYLTRLLHFGQLLEAKERFGDLIQPAEGGLRINDAVMYGAAAGRMIAEGDYLSFDIDDVVAKAQQYAAEHPEVLEE